MELALVLAPTSLLVDTLPLLAGQTILQQRRIGALRIETHHFGYVRRQWQIVVMLQQLLLLIIIIFVLVWHLIGGIFELLFVWRRS